MCRGVRSCEVEEYVKVSSCEVEEYVKVSSCDSRGVREGMFM